MKRSWVSNLIVGGVIVLLTLFLGLQYNWLRQAGDAQRERMQKRVETDTKNFADDFNRETQAAYFNFQMDGTAWESADWSEFNDRYDYWKGKTAYPTMIREFVLIGKASEQPLRYNFEKRIFETAELSPELSAVRPQIQDPKNSKQVYDDKYLLVMPVHEQRNKVERIILRRKESTGVEPALQMPERRGSLIIVLDQPTITQQILPDLSKKYFGEGDFFLDVKNKGDASVFHTGTSGEGSDATAPLFDLAPDNVMFFTNGEILSRLQPGEKPGVVVNQRIERHTFRRSDGNSEGPKANTFSVEMDNPGHGEKMRTSVITNTSDNRAPWILNVRHSSGSIDSFVKAELYKSFAIGLGAYLLLVGAIVAILISALRSKRFAQRQIDFVSSVSHEFRTPLAVIYSASENLADGVTKDEANVTRYGNLIKNEGRKLSAMVEQILEFGGARSGKKKYHFKSTDVSEVAKGAIAQCDSLLKEKGFDLETEIDTKMPLIQADANALSSAIQNLIQNSVKYSNGSRWLRVRAEQGPLGIGLEVADHGIGIATNDLRHIFEPFYRSKVVVDAQIHGNGLGLALVKEIAEAHRGRVTAKSDPGKGSEFRIEIPYD